MIIKRYLAIGLISPALLACSAIDKKNIDTNPLMVKISHTGPKIEMAHMAANRLKNEGTIELLDSPKVYINNPISGGVICSAKDECKQFVQKSVFYLSKNDDETVKLIWDVSSGRRVTIDHSIGMSKMNMLSEVPSNVASIDDENKKIEILIKKGESKEIQGPYGSFITVQIDG